jgi:hypothetical protein
MRQFSPPINAQRICLLLCLVLVFTTPLRGLAQDDQPTAEPVAEESVPAAVDEAPIEFEEPVEQQEPVAPSAPAPGAVEITLSGTNGVPLSGTFAVSDASGTYHEVWVDGVATLWDLTPGEASVTQLSGTTDYGFGSSATSYVSIPEGAVTGLQVVNVFMDADNDGIGDSLDVCAAGNDAVDTDGDGLADACDSTPTGDDDGDGIDNADDPSPTGDDDGDGVDNALDTCLTGDDAVDQDADGTPDACDAPTPGTPTGEAAPEETSDIVAMVAEELVVVEDALVTCQQADAVSPWITTDLADYPPGGLVTLAGGSWVPGQTVELVIDDDGVADDEREPWSHAATVTADETGGFTYQFNLAPWFVADYTVVATGECSEARTSFTDSVTGGNCVQVSTSEVVAVGQYIMFRCAAATNPIRFGVTSISAGWQWSYIFSTSTTLAAPAYGSLAWNAAGSTGDSSASGSNNQAYFFLSPVAGTLPAAIGTVTVQVKTPSGNAVHYTSSLTAYRTVATSNFSLSCTPPSSTVPVPGSQTVTCSLSAVNIAADATVTASIPAIAAPAGWTVTSPSPATGSVRQGAPFVFTFTLTSSCAASVPMQSVSVRSNLTHQSQGQAGPSTSVSIARPANTTVSTLISSSSLNWNRPYDFSSYPTNSGSLTYSVMAFGCAGWNITVAASPFGKSGSATTIPATNLTLTSSSSSSGTGISAPVSSGSLNGPLNVFSASPNNGIGTFTQTLDLNLNIPARTLAGTYTSTITITASSGP